jgi:hypothetical protein
MAFNNSKSSGTVFKVLTKVLMKSRNIGTRRPILEDCINNRGEVAVYTP